MMSDAIGFLFPGQGSQSVGMGADLYAKFPAARDVYDQMRPNWKGNKEHLLAQLIALVERFVRSDRIVILPPLFN
jgi:malonyl CoA-acyl carrier protein transacylase